MKRATLFIAGVALLLLADGAGAAWIENGVPVCTSPGIQEKPQIVDDGAGGIIAVWVDSRNGDRDIYAQRIDGNGNVLWALNGIPVCTAAYDQMNLSAVADGAGGIIVAWQDYRYGMTTARRYQYMTHAQRINGSGTSLWVPDGQAICSTRGTQLRPAVVSDGEGGAIIAWYDSRQSGVQGIYAQRVSASGMPMWSDTGVMLWGKTYTLLGNEYPYMASDGAGGAIVAWCDYRSGTSLDIYARKIGKNGALSWGPNGVPVCIMPSDQLHPCLVSDGAGGAIVAWTETSSGNTDIRAQRIGGAGSMLWTEGGVPVCVVNDDQSYPRIVSDGSGGAIVAWNHSGPSGGGIGMQRLDPSGFSVWAMNGVVAPLSFYDMYTFPLAPDGASGAIVAGNRYVSGDTRIVAERYNASGQRAWLPEGITVCAASGYRRGEHVISDGARGAFVAWQDRRVDTGDIYAAHVEGELPPFEVHLDIRPGSCPNPFNPKSKGVLPAAILGTADFDVSDIAPETIELAGVPPLRWSFEDVSAPPSGDAACECTAAGPDGFVDLTLKFDMPALVAQLGTGGADRTIVVQLTGALKDGTAFTGQDCFRVVGDGSKDKKEHARLALAIESSPRDPMQRLTYTLPEPAAADIAVYDVSGRLVKRFERFVEPAGMHVRNWNAAGLASGVYFCRVQVASTVETKKILILH